MPAKIFAFLPARALGDFVIAATVAASVRELFDEGELYIYYRDDRPYKKHIAGCIPNKNGVFTTPAKTGMFPLDFFDPPGGRVFSNNDAFENAKLKDTDLLLAGSMLNETALYTLPPTVLRIPPETVEKSDNALMALGLDPNKWVATVYWKEPGYPFRWEDPKRLIYDPAPYIASIRHITENLGGQVIRLGHPTDIEIPKFPGFIDLAKVPDTAWLQIYATAISRFFVGSASGPASYGPAFGVPSANTDQTLALGVWNPEDYIVSQGILYNGKIHTQLDAFDAGYLFQEWRPESEIQYVRNTAADIVAVTDEMYKSTRNCLGWRSFADHKPRLPRPNAVSVPFPRRYPPRDLLVPPSLRGQA